MQESIEEAVCRHMERTKPSHLSYKKAHAENLLLKQFSFQWDLNPEH